VSVTQGCRRILTGWPVTVGVVDTRYSVSQIGKDAERYRCACLHCTEGLAGHGYGYQCGLEWQRSSLEAKPRVFHGECNVLAVLPHSSALDHPRVLAVCVSQTQGSESESPWSASSKQTVLASWH